MDSIHEMIYDKKYLNIIEDSLSTSGKTKIFRVVNIQANILGYIRWYGGWRKYVFYPNEETLFDNNCLEEIRKFLYDETKKQKSK